MTRDEVIANFKETLCFFKTHLSVDRFTIDSMEKAISDMETVELLGQVLSELDQPKDDRGFELGKAWAYTQVSEWLENHELLRAEAKRMRVEEESCPPDSLQEKEVRICC